MKNTSNENKQYNNDMVGRKTGGPAKTGVEWGLNHQEDVGREVDPGQKTVGNDHKPMKQSGRASSPKHPGSWSWK